MPFEQIKLVHANDRLDALLSGKTEAAALMEPLVSQAAEAGARKIADLRWRGGIVANEDLDDETVGKILRALNRSVEWLKENEDRSRQELLRDLKPELRDSGLLPELVGAQAYSSALRLARPPGQVSLPATDYHSEWAYPSRPTPVREHQRGRRGPRVQLGGSRS